MESPITKRIKEYILYKGIRINQFEQSCGLSNGYINQIKKSIGDEKLKAISLRFPDLNISWILTGIGNMIQDQEIEYIDDNQTTEREINKRIGDIIAYTGLSLTAFAKHIGIAQTSLRDCVKNNSEPKYSTLNKIIIANPLISSEWLLLGTGKMLKSSSDSEKTNYEKLLEAYTKQTEDLLSERDNEIRKLQLENAILKAKESIKNVG